jgi:hypothetical protein
VLAQRAFGLDMRSFVSFGLLLGAPSGGRGRGGGGAAGAGWPRARARAVEIRSSSR